VGEVGVFVLDVRTHRSANALPDGPDKSMLGTRQRDALFSWLAGSTEKVKIIASPVLFADHSETGEDAWSSYSHEREQIFKFIVDHRIDDVLLLSGDQHWAAIFKMTRGAAANPYVVYEFQATPISKSPKAAPSVSGSDVVTTVGSHSVYGVVDIDTRSSPVPIALTLCVGGAPCDAGRERAPGEGGAPFTLHLTSKDLGFREPPAAADR
jgi:alkaline phosphatase D